MHKQAIDLSARDVGHLAMFYDSHGNLAHKGVITGLAVLVSTEDIMGGGGVLLRQERYITISVELEDGEITVQPHHYVGLMYS